MTTTKASNAQSSRFPLCKKYGLTLQRVSHKEGRRATPCFITAVKREDLESMLVGRGRDWIARFRSALPQEDFPSANDVEHTLILMEREARV